MCVGLCCECVCVGVCVCVCEILYKTLILIAILLAKKTFIFYINSDLFTMKYDRNEPRFLYNITALDLN